VIILALILIIAVVGLGAAYFTGTIELPIAAASPTPTIVILVGSPEPAEAAPPATEEASNGAEDADEGEGAELEEADELEDAGELEEADELEEPSTAEPESLDPAAAESSGDNAPEIEGVDTPTPVMALPSATPTSLVALAPTLTVTPSPTVTPTAAQASPPVQATVEPSNPGLVPTLNIPDMSGEWEYNFGVMSLNQSGVSVTGDFRWYGGANYGKISASLVYNTNQVRGLWVSDINPTVQGFTDWRLVDEGTFTGSFESGSRQGQWCGVRAGAPMPAGCGFSGVWNLHFGAPGNVSGRANLTQIGSRVTGAYTADDGRSGEIVDATITVLSLTEAILRGSWRSTSGESGSFEWRLNQTTNQSFEGRNLNGNSEWCGWREGVARPEPCGF
jgi:hypothetical protein